MIQEIITLSISASDYAPEKFWELATWCKRNGADEFTVAGRSVPRAKSAQHLQVQRLEMALQPYSLPPKARRQLTERRGVHHPVMFHQPTNLWRLTSASLADLQAFFTDGLFTCQINRKIGGLEDPIFYRSGEFMLGVVSHEQEGIVRVTKTEAETLRAMGFPFRPHGVYVGY